MAEPQAGTYRQQLEARGPLEPYQLVKLAIADGVAVITMKDPEALNAFSIRMTGELRHALAAVEDHAQVRAVHPPPHGALQGMSLQ